MDSPFLRSINTRLKKIAGEKGVAFVHIENQFLIERAVARLVKDSTLSRHLVFKGGYVGLRAYQSPRYTADLDAIVYQAEKQNVIELVRKNMADDIGDHVWFSFEREVDLTTQNEYGGTRLSFRSGIGAKPNDMKKSRLINIDIGTGDPVTPSPRKEALPLTIGEGELSWMIYPIETIAAEKIHPLVKLGPQNSRSKDIFDLYLFLPQTNVDLFRKALIRTFDFRGDKIPSSIYQLLKEIDLTLLRRGWKTAVSSLQLSPTFEVAFNVVLDWLNTHDI